MNREEKQFFMREALKLAEECINTGDVPVGCVVVREGKIVGRGKNSREENVSATSHAEIIAIEDACKNLNTRRLDDCAIFITLEPCPMCAGAIMLSRMGNIYIGAMDFLSGACGSKLNIFDWSMSPAPKIEYGILKEECKEILSKFFKKMRKQM